MVGSTRNLVSDTPNDIIEKITKGIKVGTERGPLRGLQLF